MPWISRVGLVSVRALSAFCLLALMAAPALPGDSRREAATDPRPSVIPDRVVLTWTGNPATSQAVTWRTDATVTEAFAEIAVADPSPDFTRGAQAVRAHTQPLRGESGAAHYHSVEFVDLRPATLYAYRVGSRGNWSEWFQFRTASNGPRPFSCIYFGDAQNHILSLWSRTIRAAFAEAPRAAFMIHAGDLVSHANRDREWGEWFRAGGWFHAVTPGIPVPGNHEYSFGGLSRHWRPQFALPTTGVAGLEETVYHVDYQGVRVVALNSNEKVAEQREWLEGVLSDNPQRWTFVTFHHPVFSSAKGRNNKDVRRHWKPLFDQYRVDLVLQGHDHIYARGRNLPLGVSARDQESGTVYVVSVSGPKMYTLNTERWMDRGAENTQLFQVISVAADTLHYRALTATGELCDAFDLIKQAGAANRLVERVPPGLPERTHKSELRR